MPKRPRGFPAPLKQCPILDAITFDTNSSTSSPSPCSRSCAAADDWCAVVAYGRTKRTWLATFLKLPNGIPSHDTFSEVFSRLNPDAFEKLLDVLDLSGAVVTNLHWQLDVSFDEDHRRIRKGHGAENFSRLCRLSLNLLKRESSRKAGIATNGKICGWDNDYLLKVATA